MDTLAHLYLEHTYDSTFLGDRWGVQGYVRIRNIELNQDQFICDDGWDLNDANVICRMLGFPGALDATVRSQYGVPYGTAGLSNVKCTGTENSIFDCPSDPNPTCDNLRSAGVRCLGNCILFCIEKN